MIISYHFFTITQVSRITTNFAICIHDSSSEQTHFLTWLAHSEGNNNNNPVKLKNCLIFGSEAFEMTSIFI